MAKYDWKQLEKEYILSDYKSVSAFLRSKDIKQNGSTKNRTKGWKNKKVLKEEEISTKTVEKFIEKKSEKEAEKILKIEDVANDLLLKISIANDELNKHLAKSTTKTKKVEYDYMCNKPRKEIIEEKEEIKSYIDIIDRQGLKQLTSALKDLNDILNNKKDNNENTQSLADIIQKAYESKKGEDNVNN